MKPARDHHALIAFIADREARAFAWGPNDCVAYATGAAKAQTGRDPLKGHGRRWRNETQARARLQKEGGLIKVCDRLWSRTPKSFAARGDIACVRGPTGAFLMVVEGDTLVGPGVDGAVRLPRAAMTLAWSIDR